MYNPIEFAGQGVGNLTTYTSFTGASVLVKLADPDRSSVQVWDMDAETSEPFSYRDADGTPIRLQQTDTYDVVEENFKKRIAVVNPPSEWLELTSAGQGNGRLGVDGRYATYRNRSVYVPAILDIDQWFEPAFESPGCEDIFPE